jgi:hypothetical protein
MQQHSPAVSARSYQALFCKTLARQTTQGRCTVAGLSWRIFNEALEILARLLRIAADLRPDVLLRSKPTPYAGSATSVAKAQ